jgi:hypothetical protein
MIDELWLELWPVFLHVNEGLGEGHADLSEELGGALVVTALVRKQGIYTCNFNS